MKERTLGFFCVPNTYQILHIYVISMCILLEQSLIFFSPLILEYSIKMEPLQLANLRQRILTELQNRLILIQNIKTINTKYLSSIHQNNDRSTSKAERS